jgi:hypothetical protein
MNFKNLNMPIIWANICLIYIEQIKYLNVPWIQVNICLIYLEVTKLQLILLLLEYKGMFLDEKSNNLVNIFWMCNFVVAP